MQVLLRAASAAPVRLLLLAAAVSITLVHPPAASAAENKALGRPATASSFERGGLEPSKGADGVASSRWSSGWADGQFWQVDLGRARSVDAVEINWEAAYARRYRLQTSTDGRTFSTAADVTLYSPGVKLTKFAPRQARYVRVAAVARATSWGVSFWEARVFGPVDASTTAPSAPAPAPVAPTSTPALGAVLWTADSEEGSLADWDVGYGGGEFNSGNADTVVSTEQKRSGAYAMKQIWTNNAGLQSGTRMFRWNETHRNREVYVEWWSYLPTVYSASGPWRFLNLWQIKSRDTAHTRNDSTWNLGLKSVDGSMRYELGWGNEFTQPGPEVGNAPGGKAYQPLTTKSIPTGTWFKTTIYVKQANDYTGHIKVWQDDALLYDKANVKTGYVDSGVGTAWNVDNGWSLNVYSDGITPAPMHRYLDDVRVYAVR